MTDRSFSMAEFWNKSAQKKLPEMSFKEQGIQDAHEWRDRAFLKLKELLGRLPEEAELDAEIAERTFNEDIIRETVIFNFDKYLAVKCYIFKPAGHDNKSLPALIYCPDSSAEKPEVHDEGGEHRLESWEAKAAAIAQEGYITAVPSFCFWCSSCVGIPVQGTWETYCAINFFKGALIGFYSLTMNLCFIKRCLDYLSSREDVDSGNTGIIGEGYGSMLSAFASALDNRIKAACLISSYGSWKDYYLDKSKSCGAAALPNLLKFFEFSDIAGMSAPKPLLFEKLISGSDMNNKLVDDIKEIYTAFRCQEAFSDIRYDGPASECIKPVVEFLNNHF